MAMGLSGLFKFQSLPVRSEPTAARRRPSGLYATATIGPDPPSRSRFTPPSRAQTATTPSPPPAASSSPPGAKTGPADHRTDFSGRGRDRRERAAGAFDGSML